MPAKTNKKPAPAPPSDPRADLHRAAFRAWCDLVTAQITELIEALEDPASDLSEVLGEDRIEVRNALDGAWLDLGRIPTGCRPTAGTARLEAMAAELEKTRAKLRKLA